MNSVEEEVFNKFSILANNIDDLDEINEANEYILEFKANTEECINWIINTFPQIDNTNVRIQQLILIRNYCKFGMDKLPDEVFTYFGKILFMQDIHDPFRMIDNEQAKIIYYNVLGDAQLFFMWNSYPEKYETFWTDFFSYFDDFYKLNLLSSFTDFVSKIMLDGEDNIIYNKIKKSMRENEDDSFITQFIIKKMNEGEIKAFEIFVTLSKWVDPKYLNTKESISCLGKGLTLKEYASYCLDILTCFLKRQISIEFIQESILEQISNLISSETSDLKIIESSASFVNCAGEFSIDSDFTPFFELAFLFFMSENDEVSGIVIPFLTLICKNYPEQYSEAIFSKILERLELCIGRESDESIYLENLSKLSNTAMSVNRLFYISEMIEKNEDENLLENNPNCAVSIMKIICDNLTNEPIRDSNIEFINKFVDILSVESPINSTFAFGIIIFVKFFNKFGNEFSEDEGKISYIFERLCYFSLLSNEEVEYEEFHSKISTLLDQFLLNFVSRINFNPDIISEFILTMDEQLVSAAGCLIRNLNENEKEIFTACIDHLCELFEEADQEDKMKVMYIILSFIRSLKYEEDAPHLPRVYEILDHCLEDCSIDDTLFATFIRSANSSLGPHSFDLINKCSSLIGIGEQSCSSFCNVIQSFLFTIDKGEWVGDSLESLFDIIFNKFESVEEWQTKDSPMSEENKDILKLTCNYIRFFRYAYQLARDFIDKEERNLTQKFKIFIGELMSKHFDLSNLFEVCIDYLSQIINNDIDSIFDDGFIEYLFYFLFTDEFNPLIKSWSRICKKVFFLHKHLIDKDKQNRAIEAIKHSLSNFINDSIPDKETIIYDYIKIFSLDKIKDQEIEIIKYYDNFKKTLVSQGLIG